MGGWILGGFLGLIFCVKLIHHSIPGKRMEYEVDTGNCLSCARCFLYCPYEQVRVGLITPQEMAEIEESTEEAVQSNNKV